LARAHLCIWPILHVVLAAPESAISSTHGTELGHRAHRWLGKVRLDAPSPTAGAGSGVSSPTACSARRARTTCGPARSWSRRHRHPRSHRHRHRRRSSRPRPRRRCRGPGRRLRRPLHDQRLDRLPVRTRGGALGRRHLYQRIRQSIRNLLDRRRRCRPRRAGRPRRSRPDLPQPVPGSPAGSPSRVFCCRDRQTELHRRFFRPGPPSRAHRYSPRHAQRALPRLPVLLGSTRSSPSGATADTSGSS
jgi:hypothetical protein